MLEFIPTRQVQQRLTEGWTIVSQNDGDYAAVMHAPSGWRPSLLDDRKLYRTCTIDGCDEKHKARGLCKLHYEQYSIHGDPFKVKPKRVGCTVQGCQNKHRGHGLCSTHLQRASRKAAFECREAA